MKLFLVICLIFETFLVQAFPDSGLEGSETKKLDDWKIDDIDVSLEEEISPDSQRKRDPGYYYDKPNRFTSNNHLFPSRHGHRGRIVTKLHNQVNRPFNQYGPPKHGSPLNHNRQKFTNSILNQGVPIPIRQSEFIEESPIASQNNLPFGQHTANYLPPKNQKLPLFTAPNLFSNQNHDFPKPQNHHHHQQQQPQLQIQQQPQLQIQQQPQLQIQQQPQLQIQQQPQLQIQQQQQFNQLQNEQREQQQEQLLQQHQQQFNQIQQQQFNQLQQQQFNQLQKQQINQLHQQQFNQVQQQFTQAQQQQKIQLQTNDQNSFGQDFGTFNSNQQQNEFNNQQISDAALFLSQNAPAISKLYETPAINQNYAPYNQESQQEGQNQILNHNLQIQTQNELPQFSNQQLPSYSSGILNSQQTLEDVKSLEKDRLISQLRLELSSRENAARFVQNTEDIRNTQNQDSIPEVSLFSQRNRQLKLEQVGTSLSQSETFSSPSTAISSSSYPSYYPPPVAAPHTQRPALSTPSPPVSPVFPPSHSNSESGSTQVSSSLPVPGNAKPPTTSTYSQYGGFVPTIVSSTNFVPSIPSFGTTLIPTNAIKPTENAPTHFGIPIPTLPDEKSLHPLPNSPTTLKPTSISLQPGISTVSIPLGPVHHFSTHPQVIKPSPIPVIPDATPIHPTYGIHPAVINPSFVYKPVKVYPVYYYPKLGYSSPLRKSIYSTAVTQPWSYAPSYGQAKPIWK